jgi:hypothetical protein
MDTLLRPRQNPPNPSNPSDAPPHASSSRRDYSPARRALARACGASFRVAPRCGQLDPIAGARDAGSGDRAERAFPRTPDSCQRVLEPFLGALDPVRRTRKCRLERVGILPAHVGIIPARIEIILSARCQRSSVRCQRPCSRCPASSSRGNLSSARSQEPGAPVFP